MRQISKSSQNLPRSAVDRRESAIAFASFWVHRKDSKKTRHFRAAEFWRADCLCTGGIDETFSMTSSSSL